jgi:hypothetical protein
MIKTEEVEILLNRACEIIGRAHQWETDKWRRVRNAWLHDLREYMKENLTYELPEEEVKRIVQKAYRDRSPEVKKREFWLRFHPWYWINLMFSNVFKWHRFGGDWE